MQEMNIANHPIIEKFGMHGCMMCPFRSGDYYLGLKENFPDLYQKATQWRQAGGTTKEGSEYYYLFTPAELKKTLSGEQPEKEKYISEGKPIF